MNLLILCCETVTGLSTNLREVSGTPRPQPRSGPNVNSRGHSEARPRWTSPSPVSPTGSRVAATPHGIRTRPGAAATRLALEWDDGAFLNVALLRFDHGYSCCPATRDVDGLDL